MFALQHSGTRPYFRLLQYLDESAVLHLRTVMHLYVDYIQIYKAHRTRMKKIEILKSQLTYLEGRGASLDGRSLGLWGNSFAKSKTHRRGTAVLPCPGDRLNV